MVHRLDVVSVRIDDECTVTTRGINWSLTRFAVVAASGRESGLIERVDGGTVSRNECHA